MKRYRLSVLPVALVLAAASLAACSGGSNAGQATDCSTMTLATVDDDAQRAGLWAIENHKVTSDRIRDLKVSYLQIPALIGATGTNQFDVVQTSVNGVPRAIASGLDLKIVMLSNAQTGGGQRTWVRAGSPITSVSDLKGKTVGLLSLGSTGYLFAAKTFQDKYHVNPAQVGGDVKWVELDPPTLLNALRKGDVDAAVMALAPDWQASQDPGLRLVGDMPAEYRQLTGQWPLGAAFVMRTPAVNAAPDCVTAFQQLITQSADYAKAHINEIGPQIAQQTGAPLGWVQYYWSGKWEYAGMDNEWIARGQAALDAAYEFGQLKQPVNISTLIAAPAHKE